MRKYEYRKARLCGYRDIGQGYTKEKMKELFGHLIGQVVEYRVEDKTEYILLKGPDGPIELDFGRGRAILDFADPDDD